MSLVPKVDPFKGTDWEECNGFIRALRFRALWEGKQRDPAWIADFAAPHFSHKALVWHSRLSQDVRQDWFKLETALIERWAPPEEGDDTATVPTPAAASPVKHVKRAENQLQGVLKAVLNESNVSYYVKLGSSGVCYCLTRGTAEALRLRCNSLSDVTLLERTDGSCHSWLAVHWPHAPQLGNNSAEYLTCSITRNHFNDGHITEFLSYRLWIQKV